MTIIGSENSVSCNEKYRETFGVGELFDFVIFEPRAVVGVVRAFFLMHIGPCTKIKEEEKCFIWLSEVSALYRRENCTK